VAKSFNRRDAEVRRDRREDQNRKSESKANAASDEQARRFAVMRDSLFNSYGERMVDAIVVGMAAAIDDVALPHR
jgi:hypothetical protein